MKKQSIQVVLTSVLLMAFTVACQSQTPPNQDPDTLGQGVSQTCGSVTPYRFPTDLYPFTDRCVNLGYGNYHYFDETPAGTLKGTVLMVHGNPTSSFLYRNIALNLRNQGYRVIAMDHYGFGESAKPPLEQFGYLPSQHAITLTRFVDMLGLQNLTLVVQDWGGPVGLEMAMLRPKAIKNILIMNTWAWQVTNADLNGPYGDLVRWSQYHQQNSATVIPNASIPRATGIQIGGLYPAPLNTEVQNAYWEPFINVSSGQAYNSTVATPTSIFAQSILLDTTIFSALGKLQAIRNKPVYFYYGQQDPYFGALTPNPDGTCALGASNGTYCTQSGNLIYPYIDRFLSLWNPAQVKGTEINPTAEHFIQEYAPDRIAALVNLLNGY
jgi:pimeloyl-ACP methyl ester carboxylesterase